ncbi:hypothetical protein PTSG_09745 [Salpingoeca rosetta]|uniref:Amino acid transporter transmembrane domain-containing protein n=1 Tax=Salpingoeca rosetta (strain ATCC 50818 / BSB-021) TaxID=946362 RepID=F2UNX6_SALR5|nr:uncharacterized protein PTSG_09745 [Salpingoeca rosetta]EGD79331.1 hypothetical protein PTSG_09745 [Salpingoeca rosetta]|eukprot:XP_004989100.1 hypothetical protein PTSG_09745 [Salpingoeca rosetta]
MSQDEGNALLSGTGTGGASIQTPYQQQQQQQQQHYGGGGDDDSQPLISSVSRQGDESEDTIEELDPHHVGTKMTSFTETLINFLKGNICAGFLSLPFAFAQGGYVGGTALLAFIASICVHCMLLLVKTKQHVCAENKITRLSYGQLAEHAIGRAGIMIVNAALLVTQFGFVCVYVVFIAQHIQEGSITLNLPSNALFGSVKIALCLALFQSIGIQYFPPIGIIERTTMPKIKARFASPKMRLIVQNGLRTIITLIVVGIAIAIPHLGLIISLIGSLGAGLLALILPPLMHLRLVPNLPTWVKVKNICIMIFGVIGSIAGVFVSIKELINAS